MTLSLENKGLTDEKLRKQYTFILLNSKTSTLLSAIKRGHSMTCINNMILCPKYSEHYFEVVKYFICLSLFSHQYGTGKRHRRQRIFISKKVQPESIVLSGCVVWLGCSVINSVPDRKNRFCLCRTVSRRCG